MSRALVIGVIAVGARWLPAEAQPRGPTASDVLWNVQQVYWNQSDITAQVQQIVTSPRHPALFSVARTTLGRLWVSKAGAFRLDSIERRAAKVHVTRTSVFDGTTQWSIDHPSRQLVQSPLPDPVLAAAVTFFTSTGTLASQFTATLDASGRYGGTTTFVLALTPRTPSPAYSELVVVVDPTDWRITESIVLDANGVANRFKLYRPDFGTARASWFHVNPVTLPSYTHSVLQPPPAAAAAAAPPAIVPPGSPPHGASPSVAPSP